MERGGRDDRRESRRRSRSRSWEGRRRRSSGGGVARGPSRRSRSRSRSRTAEHRRHSDGGRSKDARPQAEPAAAAQPAPQPAAPPPADPGPAPTVELVAPTRDNLKLLMATRSDLEALREVERLLVVYNYQHPTAPSLTCLRGLFVRTRYDGYHIRMINRLLEDDGQVKLLVQVGMALDSRPVVTWELDVKFVSGANPLTDPTYAKGGQAELAQLQEELARLNCALPLQQCAAAVVRRRAALHWWDKYGGEPDMQQFLPRLIADLQDEGDIQRAARRFELLPPAGAVTVPPQPGPVSRQPPASAAPTQAAPTQPLSSTTQQPPQQQLPQQQAVLDVLPQQPNVQQELPGAGGGPRHKSPPTDKRADDQQQEQQRQQQQRQQQEKQEKKEQQRQESPRNRRQESPDRKQRRESPRKRQRSPDRRQASPDRKQRRESPSRWQRSPDRKQRRESPSRRQRSPDRRPRRESPSRLQRRDSTPQQQQQQQQSRQPLPSPGDTAASGNQGRKTQDQPGGAAAYELRDARKAAQDNRPAGRSAPPAADGGAATEAAGGKRKRAPIQWQPQEPQPGDRPLMVDGSLAPEPPAKAKQQAGSGGTRDSSPAVAAAADGKGELKTHLSITLKAPPAGALPAGHDAELPPGFGGPDLPAPQLPASAFRAADYATEPDGGSGSLVVRVRMPHDLPAAMAPMDLSTGGSASTLGGRFDRLNASQRLGSEALQASPSAHFLLTTSGVGASMPATAPPPQMFGAASLAARFDGQQYTGLQQQLSGQQAYSGQPLSLPQQHYGGQPQQQMYSPPGEQFLAMLGGDAVQASIPFGSGGSYGDAAERGQSEVVSPSHPTRRTGKDGGSERGDRRVQVERSDSIRSGGASSSGAAMWCPMTTWETAALRLLHEQPGITLGEMAGLHPLPPCWSGNFAAFAAYVLRRKQLFNVDSLGVDRERATVYASKGARAFLSFKRRVLQYLADHRPRVDVNTVLSNVPTEGLPPYLLDELGRNPVTFLLKYLGCEVAAVEPARGGLRDARLLELRPFPPKASGGHPLTPQFRGVCTFWQKGHCNKGDRCDWAHATPRTFSDPKHPALTRGK